MEWIFFTLIAVFFWSASVTIDKYILEKYIREALICLIVLGLVGLISSLAIFLKNFVLLSPRLLILSLLTGIIYTLSILGYFKAMKIEEASRVISLFNISPLFVLILATLFLNETLLFKEYLGILFLVLGAVLISIKRDFKLRNPKAFIFIFGSAIFFAIYDVLTKYLLNFADYWTIYAYIRIGSFLAVIPLIYLYLPELKSTISKFGKKVLGFMVASETLNVIALISSTAAISFGYVSLVSGLTSILPLFVLILVSFISIFYPAILKEELKGSIFAVKLIAIILICLGGFLIT